VILEVGDRTAGEVVTCPRDDVQGSMQPDGHWSFKHLDGSPSVAQLPVLQRGSCWFGREAIVSTVADGWARVVHLGLGRYSWDR
jgi:hypothetical protein